MTEPFESRPFESRPFETRPFGSQPFGAPGHLGDALSALLDGELPAVHADAARSHLATCPDCAAELGAVGQARAWVRTLPAVDPPFGFYERLLLDRPPVATPLTPGNSLRRRAGVVALGAAAAAVTVLSFGSPRQSPVAPAAPHVAQFHATNASIDLLSKLAPMGVPGSGGR